MNIEQLRDKYLELVNQTLPNLAKQRQFPVRFNNSGKSVLLTQQKKVAWQRWKKGLKKRLIALLHLLLRELSKVGWEKLNNSAMFAYFLACHQ